MDKTDKLRDSKVPIEDGNSGNPKPRAIDFLNFSKIRSALTFDPALLHEAVDDLWSFLSNTKQEKPNSVLGELDFQSMFSRGRIDEAIENLSMLLELEKGSKDIHKYIALSFIVKENFDMALHYLNEALWIDPNDADLYLQKGNILLRRNMTLEAYTCFVKAHIMNPNLKDAKDLKQKLFKKLELDKNPASHHYVLGTIYQDLSSHEDALKHYNLTLEIDPNHDDALYNKMIIEDYTKRRTLRKPIPLKSLPIVTLYEYSTMSEAVYVKSKVVVPDGWEVLTTSNDQTDENGNFSRDGFYAAAYINHQKKHIMVAIQGSETGDDIISSAHLVFNRMDRQWICAKKFTERVFDAMRYDDKIKDYHISATGHSLGGAQAEFLSYLFNIQAITFESPGALELIRHYDEGKTIDPKTVRCTSFLARPNIINTAKTHSGKVYRMYPPLPSQSFKAENTTVILKRLEFLKKLSGVISQYSLQLLEETFGREILQFLSKTELMIIETDHWHSMVNICKTFQSEYNEGVPVKLREVISWPSVDRYYLYWRVTKEIRGNEPDEFVVGELNQEALRCAGYVVKPEATGIQLKDFTKEELLFLCEYNRNPTEYEPHITSLEKTILDSVEMTPEQIKVQVGISNIHFCSFIAIKTRELREITERLSAYYTTHVKR